MANLFLYEVAQSQLSKVDIVDGQIIVCTDTGNVYRDLTDSRIPLGSGITAVTSLPLAPISDKLYLLKPNKLYVYDGAWQQISGGGGGSSTLYSELGTNTDGQLTQATATEKITDRPYVVIGNTFPQASEIPDTVLLFDVDDVGDSGDIDIPTLNSNYETLSNKPSVEGVTLIGNKTFPQLGLESITNVELENLLT